VRIAILSQMFLLLSFGISQTAMAVILENEINFCTGTNMVMGSCSVLKDSSEPENFLSGGCRLKKEGNIVAQDVYFDGDWTLPWGTTWPGFKTSPPTPGEGYLQEYAFHSPIQNRKQYCVDLVTAYSRFFAYDLVAGYIDKSVLLLSTPLPNFPKCDTHNVGDSGGN